MEKESNKPDLRSLSTHMKEIEKPWEDKDDPYWDPFGFKMFEIDEALMSLLSCLAGTYSVVQRQVRKTDPVKADQLLKRSIEFGLIKQEEFAKPYSEREMAIIKYTLELRELEKLEAIEERKKTQVIA
jgi:hypothetical protein